MTGNMADRHDIPEEHIESEEPKPRRRPGRPPKKKPHEELFSFNEESLEGERARSVYLKEMMSHQRRELTNGNTSQPELDASYLDVDYFDNTSGHKDLESDEWVSGQEDNDEDEWQDDDEDESWIDWEASSEAELDASPEEQVEEAALVEELHAAEEIRAVAESVRKEEDELRRAIAASLSEDGSDVATCEPVTEMMPEIKVEPWVPSKAEIPITSRRLRYLLFQLRLAAIFLTNPYLFRPPWLSAYQLFQARGSSAEELRIEAENEWKRFVAEGPEHREWIKVPPTVNTWEAIVNFVQQRKKEAEELQNKERRERREKRVKEIQEQLLEEANQGDEEDDQDKNADDEADEDEEHDEDESDEDRGRKNIIRGRRRKKKDMLTQLLDCFKEKDLEKVLVVDAAARKRKPPRKYGIDEWYHRRR